MAQVSLYLDKDTFRKVETASQMNGLSISRYVASIIQAHFNHEWPSDFAGLFGSVTDETFFPHGAKKVTEDTVRESL